MKDFTDESYAAFQEAAIEKYDFSTCQRADGSYYGTGGTCRKGSPVNGVPEKEKKGKASGGGGVSDSQAAALSKDLTRQIGEAAKKGDKKAVDNLMQAKATVDSTIKARKAAGGGAAASSKDVRALDKKAKDADKKAEAADNKWRKGGMKDKALQKEVRSLDKEAKAANRAAEKADKAFQSSQKIQARTKKLSAEYEKLRGDTSPKATARRKKIMEDVNKNVAKQKDLQKTIDEAGRSGKGPDTSPAANQRRANAATRARD